MIKPVQQEGNTTYDAYCMRNTVKHYLCGTGGFLNWQLHVTRTI